MWAFVCLEYPHRQHKTPPHPWALFTCVDYRKFIVVFVQTTIAFLVQKTIPTVSNTVRIYAHVERISGKICKWLPIYWKKNPIKLIIFCGLKFLIRISKNTISTFSFWCGGLISCWNWYITILSAFIDWYRQTMTWTVISKVWTTICFWPEPMMPIQTMQSNSVLAI